MSHNIPLPFSLPLDLVLAFAVPVVGGLIGYEFGKWASSAPVLPDSKATEQTEEDGDESAWIADGDLAAVSAGLLEPCKMVLVHWERTGQAKIALKAKSEDQLLELEAIAKSLNLCARSVLDPEKGDNVRSVLAIGPAPVRLVDEVTGKLRLL
ncbi:hypothetical protein CVT26_000435 [Gymnopilus dilepis]|uniref:peptidyl-tRNA hydrolase n=1 Tax=Gymnopilus dilepis TaxID=231916 RepID=A0A409Y2G1_9AGAR|nr:hypothetical protein CVT26_000435 [Gymnopilus dilepis]